MPGVPTGPPGGGPGARAAAKTALDATDRGTPFKGGPELAGRASSARFRVLRRRGGRFGRLHLLAVARQAPARAFLERQQVHRPPPQLRDVLQRLARRMQLEVAAVVPVREQQLALALEVVVDELDLRQAAPGELLQQALLDLAEAALEHLGPSRAAVLAE